jgi:hypothetical protein
LYDRIVAGCGSRCSEVAAIIKVEFLLSLMEGIRYTGDIPKLLLALIV